MVKGMNSPTVTEALYQSHGNPQLDKPVSFDAVHLCGNCQRRRSAAPAGKILTAQFGSWQDVAVDPTGGRWLCLPCAWSYRAADLRRMTTEVSVEGASERLDTAALRERLSKPLSPNHALIVPLGGKKIVAPRAQWGMLASDHAVLAWSARHSRTLKTIMHLRELGFNEAGLSEPSPPYVVMVALDYAIHDEVKRLWSEVAWVREDKILKPLMWFASRDTKRKVES